MVPLRYYNWEQEQERGITITSAATTTFWNYPTDVKGDPTEDTHQYKRCVCLTVPWPCSVPCRCVEPQSETVWRQADKYSVPRICFVNKIQAAS